jgi:hypothetical protein
MVIMMIPRIAIPPMSKIFESIDPITDPAGMAAPG